MKTPITDAAWQDWIATGNASQSLARPMSYLEADRAALMEACSLWISERDNPSPCWVIKKRAEDKMRSALSAARANFPEQR